MMLTSRDSPVDDQQTPGRVADLHKAAALEPSL